MSGCRHPVCRQLHCTQPLDVGGGNVGDRLADGHPPRGAGIDASQRRTLTHRERLATVALKTHRRHRDVGHRHLPRSDKLVTCGQATDRTVANADQKVLAGNGWHAQHTHPGFLQIQVSGIEGRQMHRAP